jgi:hypothetical protein
VASGGDPGQEYWWHVTELTLDHLRPSPKWIREGEELALAKECEAMAARGLEKMAKLRRKQEEKMRMLREVAELFSHNWSGREKEMKENLLTEPGQMGA